MPTTISIVKLSDLKRFNRLDPEYYQPVYLEYYKSLKNSGSLRLGDHSKIIDGIHTSIDYDTTSNIRCLHAKSVKNGFLTISADDFISDSQHRKNLRTSIKDGDIIISSVGTIGNVSVATPHILPANADRDVGIIHIEDELNPFYVSAFLNSKYGRFQTTRESTGNVQLHLFIDKMKELLVPKLTTQDAIGNLVKKSIDKFFEAKEKMDNAENILLAELEISPEKLSKEISYIRTYRSVMNSNRLDPEYFHPKYDDLLSAIFKFSPEKLSILAKPIKTKAKLTPNKLYQYVEIGDVDVSTGEVDFTVRDYVDLPPNAKIDIKGGELIISKVRPTRGAIGIVPKECHNDSVCSSAFAVYHVPSPLREYIQIVLRTFIGKMQLEKPTKGTSYPTIEDSDIAEVLIPKMPIKVVESISNEVHDASKIRYEAKKLFNDAVRKTEEDVSNLISSVT